MSSSAACPDALSSHVWFLVTEKQKADMLGSLLVTLAQPVKTFFYIYFPSVRLEELPKVWKNNPDDVLEKREDVGQCFQLHYGKCSRIFDL